METEIVKEFVTSKFKLEIVRSFLGTEGDYAVDVVKIYRRDCGEWKRDLMTADVFVPYFCLLLEYAKEWLIENPANPFKPTVLDEQDYEGDDDYETNENEEDESDSDGDFRLPTDLNGRLGWRK